MAVAIDQFAFIRRSRRLRFRPESISWLLFSGYLQANLRKYAELGDWVAGFGSKSKGRAGHIVFAMQITEDMSFNEYWHDARFAQKQPAMEEREERRCGDNIYYRPERSDDWTQLHSHHSNHDGSQNWRHFDGVLISDEFVYWDGQGPKLPPFCEVSLCHQGRGYKKNFPDEAVQAFIEWIGHQGEAGFCGKPLE